MNRVAFAVLSLAAARPVELEKVKPVEGVACLEDTGFVKVAGAEVNESPVTLAQAILDRLRPLRHPP